MVKADLVQEVMRITQLPRTKALLAVECMFHCMKNALMTGNRIELRGFGVFQVSSRKRGIGRNPRTGEEVEIPPGRAIKFKPGKELRNLL